MTKKKRQGPGRSPAKKKQQAQGASSLAIPIVVGVVVVAIIVGAILSIENRQPTASALPGDISVPIITAQPRPTTTIPFPNVERISTKDAKEKMDKGQAILIDVRSQVSYDASHAAGAVSIPEEEIAARLSEIPHDKEVILYCT
jgi:hypothetical protein